MAAKLRVPGATVCRICGSILAVRRP